METFSKLRPPEAVRIKAKLIESSSNNDQETSSPRLDCDQNHNNNSPVQHLDECVEGGCERAIRRASTMSRNKDRRISSASQVSTISTSSSSCTSYGGSVSSAPPHQTNHTSDQRICELKKFCVDPQVTSFDVLRDLIAHAFAIKSEFRLSYLNRSNDNKQEMGESEERSPSYISLQTDWDLDAAFSSSSQPYLSLNIELLAPPAPSSFQSPTTQQQIAAEAISEEWEVINSSMPSTSSSASSSPVPADTTTNSASSSSGDQPSSPKASVAVAGGQKLIPKSRSTVIHKCVSAIHKVFNNFARSNSFNNTPLTTSPNEPRRGVSEIEEEDQHRRCLTPSLSVPRSPSLSGAGTAPPPVSPQAPTTPHNTSTTTYSERSTAATVAAAAAALLTGGAQFYHKAPLGEAELRNFCDSDGRIVNLVDLKQRIFEGGCEAAKRRELWPILLDIYPHVCATRQQRDDFLRLKQAEYAAAKHSLWMRDHRDLMARSSAHCISDSSFDSNNPHGGANLSAFGLPPHHAATFDLNALYSLAHKIHKDVCRTDRNQKFFAGDCNPNVASLFNILITYSLAHPHMPYAQGMSDLLSPLLYVLRDESLAYACFVALMNRCASDFCVHSDSISLKIKLLGSLLARYDPELWSHLVQVGADQMLFVYRWLLLECKREFPFEDSLRVLECMWSTIDNTSSRPTAIWSNNMDMMSRSSYLTRSNSTVSSSTVSLRLFKDICRTGGVAGLRAISNDDYGVSNVGGCGASEEPDDDFVGSENMDESMSIGASTKSRHQSQASSTATNNHVSHKETCDMCRGSSTTTANNNSERKSSPSLMIKRRTSSTIDDLSSDLSSSTRSRTNSSSSSLTSSSSITSDDEESEEMSDSSDICDELDGLLKNDDDDEDEDFKPVAEETSKSAKPMAVARLRRFSLNLSFLKSSSKSKTKRDAKLDEIATPPTSASLTNELECSNLISRQRRFQLNKRFFSIIKKKKETRVESNENEFYCSSPQQELKNETKCEERQSRCRHLSSNQPRAVAAIKSPVRSKSLGNLDHVDIGESPSWIRSRAKSSGVPASTARQCEVVKGRCVVRVCNEQGRLLFAKKKSSLPVYMKAATAVNAATANQIAMSSSTKFSTSEAETIVMAASNNQSANNLRSSFCRQLSHSPTIVNTVGSQKLSHNIDHHNYHRSTPKGKKTTTQNENTKEASKSNREKSTHHKKSSRRTRARQYCAKTTTTTTTGEDESERGTMKRSRRKKPHRHHEKKTAVVSTSPSFKHIKNSLKRSQRYLNSFYASKMTSTTTSTSAKTVESEAMKKPADSANKPANDEKIAANATFACVAARANTNGTANTSTATCNRSQTSKCTNNTHSSSKSSTSAYVSAAHSLASSHSSLCSTNFNQISHPLSNGYSQQQQQQHQQQSKVTTATTTSSRRSSFVSKQIPIINITSPVSGATKSVAVDEQESEEELIYQLSKLDNPFLLFMCLSMFIEHRKHIMRSQMDANDIACYFDKMARKHCVRPILARARYLYTKLYLAKANVFSYIQQLMDIQNSP